MSYQKANTPYTWVNEEDSKTTPINAEKLNEKEATIDTMDNRIVELEAMKASKATVNSMVQDVQMNMATGVLTVTYVNGSIQTYDTAIEKIAVNFAYDATTEKITITLEDGNVQEIDLSAFITNYSFEDSETVAFNSDGSNVTAIVKEGSIEEKHLRPDYLAEIKVQSANANTSANSASNSAESASNDATTASDKAGEALASAIRAENAADRAEAVTDIHYATKDRAGIVAPQDIHVDEQGNMVMIAETTDSTLRNSYAGGIVINEVVGADEQETTSGAQKINSDSLVGTAAKTTNVITEVAPLTEGSYVFCIEYAGGKVGSSVSLKNSSGAEVKSGQSATATIPITLTAEQAASVDSVEVYPYSANVGLVFETLTLNAGTEVLAAEKFSGGIASPNPAYPQSIDSVVVSEVVSYPGQLFDKDNALYVLGISVDADNGIFKNSQPQVRIYYVEVKPNTTYTFSKTIGTFNRVCTSPNIPSLNGKITNFNTDTTNNVATITTGENDRYIAFYPLLVSEIGNITFESVLDTVMLNYGTVVLPLEPYVEPSAITLSKPITLHSKDRIVKQDGVCDVGRGMATLNVAECTITDWGAGGDGHDFFINVEAWADTNQRDLQALCNKFIYRADAMAINHFWYKSNVGGWDGYSRLAFRVPADINTVAKFKEYVGNDCIVLYETKETTFEPLPTADQIALNSLKSFDGVTHVETDSEVKPTIHSKYGTSKVGAMALELQNENANLKLQKSSVSTTETKVSVPSKMTTGSAEGFWNVELERPTDADYTLLGWTIINPKADVVNLYVTTVDGYSLRGSFVESGAHAAFSVTIRAMWKAL